MTTDPILADILAAIAVLQGGDKPGGRSKLEAIWARIAHAPEPFHVCVLSHYMADAQDDLAEELAWDLRALNAASSCSEEDARRRHGTLSIAAFMPSLYLNLADDYLRLGEIARSKEHLASARLFLDALPDDGYGQLIRRGLDRLAKKVDTG